MQRFSPALVSEVATLSLRQPDLRLGDGFVFTLKQVGYFFAADLTRQLESRRVLEMGAGRSLIWDEKVAGEHEYWMADQSGFYPAGEFAKYHARRKRTRLVETLVTHGSPLPENYFDAVFSVSVIEHVPENDIEASAAEQFRVIAPGGWTIHSLDLGINDLERARRWHAALTTVGFRVAPWRDPKREEFLLEPFETVFRHYGGPTRTPEKMWLDARSKKSWYFITWLIAAQKPA